jgi:glutathione S-transferase
MPDLGLVGGPQSNYVWICRIALAEKGVPYKLTATMPHTPVADAIHPLGKTPSMRHCDVTL